MSGLNFPTRFLRVMRRNLATLYEFDYTRFQTVRLGQNIDKKKIKKGKGNTSLLSYRPGQYSPVSCS